MDDKFRKFVEMLASKDDPKFDPDVEYWDWGNSDDVYSFGCDCGEQGIYRLAKTFLDANKESPNNPHQQ